MLAVTIAGGKAPESWPLGDAPTGEARAGTNPAICGQGEAPAFQPAGGLTRPGAVDPRGQCSEQPLRPGGQSEPQSWHASGAQRASALDGFFDDIAVNNLGALGNSLSREPEEHFSRADLEEGIASFVNCCR